MIGSYRVECRCGPSTRARTLPLPCSSPFRCPSIIATASPWPLPTIRLSSEMRSAFVVAVRKVVPLGVKLVTAVIDTPQDLSMVPIARKAAALPRGTDRAGVQTGQGHIPETKWDKASPIQITNDLRDAGGILPSRCAGRPDENSHILSESGVHSRRRNRAVSLSAWPFP